jgi:2-polyprenyl-3-methyl-5-hydroxy-6-metoxy-1,4-benzoquinol methylase
MLELPDNIDYIEVMFPRGAFIIRKFCENYRGGRVLDAGCGKGRFTKYFGKLGIGILGIDIDANEIKKAIDSNEYDNVQFACVNVNELPSREFSGCLLTEVLEHTEEPSNFLKEINRLCENDGFLILTIPNGYSFKEVLTAAIRLLKNIKTFAKLVKWYRKVTKRDQVFNDSPHIQQFTLRKIRYLIKESGFTIKEEFYCDIWSGFLWKFFVWIPVPFFVRKIETRITKYVPYYFLGDWGFLCVKKSQG